MAWATAVDMYGGGIGVHDALRELWDQPWAPVRDLWGTSPTAEDGQRAMMNLAGGPARPRKS